MDIQKNMKKYIGVNYESVDWQDIEDCIVIYATQDNSFYQLESAAARSFWEMLDGSKTLEQVISALSDVYEVSVERISEDVRPFLEFLSSIDALILSDTSFEQKREE